MSEEKFTPGPWVIDTIPSHENANNCYSFLIRSKGWHISAIHNDPNENDFEGNDEEIANANLIAAAPEMYHALKHVKEWFGKLKDWEGVGDPDVVEIMFAIDKAEGNISNLKTKTP